ncbi:MAG: 2-amino-4-hydroxy-6-hydroxymethyldihydropteridine diphosphokinase [Actinobacteria bacterium]|nr:2-amino-4-hydroxy-6-hydroxymethyldihydropteridine diphosphokinase [Actinomycetota bacterium]
MRPVRRALVALGSNIDPEANLPRAVALLAECPALEVIAVSGAYESPSLDRPGDPRFRNAALLLQTRLSPGALRVEFRRVEAAMGRVRGADRYAPRLIDIDLAAYEGFAGTVGDNPVPHPDIPRRAFLALPLAEVAPGWHLLPAGRTLREIAAGFDLEAEQVRRLPGPALGLAPRAADPEHPGTPPQTVAPPGLGDAEKVDLGEIFQAAAVEAEFASGRREATVAQAKRSILVRIVTVAAGTLVLMAGIAMLALPGPGWITIAAGLAILSVDVPFARRLLQAVRRRLPASFDGKLPLRVTVGMILVGVLFTAAGIWLALIR